MPTRFRLVAAAALLLLAPAVAPTAAADTTPPGVSASQVRIEGPGGSAAGADFGGGDWVCWIAPWLCGWS